MIKFIDKLKENKLLNKLLKSEFILYVIVGGLTTLINWIIYAIFTDSLKGTFGDHSYKVAYVIAFIIAVLFAYIADKVLVFKNKDFGLKNMGKEFVSFISARLISSGIGFVLTIISVEALKKGGIAPDIAAKVGILPAFVFNIVFNYIVSKFFIFKKKD